jgi:hypothetical protein
MSPHRFEKYRGNDGIRSWFARSYVDWRSVTGTAGSRLATPAGAMVMVLLSEQGPSKSQMLELIGSNGRVSQCLKQSRYLAGLESVS